LRLPAILLEYQDCQIAIDGVPQIVRFFGLGRGLQRDVLRFCRVMGQFDLYA
jgi:hypothetical protein